MELERTHTQPRDPNTREHVIDNYDNNEQDNNTGDNLKQYTKNCVLESATVQLGSLELDQRKMLCYQYREKKDGHDYSNFFSLIYYWLILH